MSMQAPSLSSRLLVSVAAAHFASQVLASISQNVAFSAPFLRVSALNCGSFQVRFSFVLDASSFVFNDILALFVIFLLFRRPAFPGSPGEAYFSFPLRACQHPLATQCQRMADCSRLS